MKTFNTISLIVLIAITIFFIRKELSKPINHELLRTQECEVKLGGTKYEKGCNEFYAETYGDTLQHDK